MVPRVSERADDERLPSGPEVIVVGGGLFGCLLAHRLTVRGVRVLLLEADDVGARAARERLVLDPGLSRLDPDGASRSRRLLSMLSAQAPHLCRTSTAAVATPGGRALHRTLSMLELHDRSPEGPLADARAITARERLRHPIALTAHTLDEQRLVLALALSALARGADVKTGARVRSIRAKEQAGADRLEVTVGEATVCAPIVVLAAGGDVAALLESEEGARGSLLPSTPLEHALELLIRPRISPHALVDPLDALRVEHLPTSDGSFVRITGPRPIELEEALAALARVVAFDLRSIEVHDRQSVARHVGEVSVHQGRLEGLFTVTGNELVSAHTEVQRLAHALAIRLGRPSTPDMGDDARLEDGDFEVTAAIERTRLGAEILSTLAARHGERASAIAERVMRSPREGALVCPCRTVIEAELRHAHREELARDLSALSRRTELGTGACVGVRCAHRAAAVLADETAAHGQRATDDAIAFLQARDRAAHLDPDRAAILTELREGMARAAGLGPIVAERSDG